MAGTRTLLALFGIALAAMPGGAAAQTARESASKPPSPLKEPDFPPIVFFIAKGEDDACGPGCNEWIAADGKIDREAGQRFRAFLDQTKRKLPVYFHSPGGSANAATEIGRIMRHRAMTASVARTIPQGCDPGKERESACDAIKRSGGDLPAELRTVRTLCASACVFALIGATVREVTAGARIGVHAGALRVSDEEGAAIKSARHGTLTSTDREALKRAHAALAGYAVSMGIDRGLADAAAAVSHERIRYISRDEIARFGIDKREFHESKWTVDEGPPGPLVVVKFVTERRGESDAKRHRSAKIELACTRSKDIRVTYSRELIETDRPVSIAVSGKGGDFVLPPPQGKPILGYNYIEMEDRYARVPISFFEDAAAGEVIEFTEAPDVAALDKPSRRTRLSTAGLKHAIGVLAQRCSERAR
ncbi:MAG: hypothetical protein WCE79_24000 [Xanthobacteraceae bacterium]